MSEYPSSWIEVNLGELLQFNYGKSLPNRIRSGAGFPVYGSNGVVGYHNSALTDRETLIIGRKGSVGEVHFSPRPCYPIDTTYYVDQFHGMSARYWLYLLKNLRLNELNKATAIPGINREDAYRIKVNLAPLNEQKRIADKLGVLLAQVDTCRERLDRIPLILKRFRQAVLAAATSGQLTEDWRTEMNRSLDSWHTKYGEDVFPFITSGSRGWASYYAQDGAIFLRVGNLAHDTIELDLQKLQYVNLPSSAEGKRARIKVGDILISITADVGMVAFVHEDIGEAYINQHLCLARQTGEYSGAYLAYYLTSPLGGFGQLTQVQQGTTKAGLTLGDIRAVTLLIPELDEQQEIVRRVEALFTFADRLEARYQAARTQVERLTPALLAKAFRGELVSQDSNDEPASMMLERIRAQRATQPSKPKRSPASRKQTMTKMTEESVKEAIRQLPNDKFSFDELRENLPGDYESLKNILFKFLSEAEPSLTQTFDRDERTMCFVRAGK
jgi:type I restriction enzyme S subunit